MFLITFKDKQNVFPALSGSLPSCKGHERVLTLFLGFCFICRGFGPECWGHDIPSSRDQGCGFAWDRWRSREPTEEVRAVEPGREGVVSSSLRFTALLHILIYSTLRVGENFSDAWVWKDLRRCWGWEQSSATVLCKESREPDPAS